ncbi:MAG: PilZ domain-containing protein [Dehalococcoidia bacterium]
MRASRPSDLTQFVAQQPLLLLLGSGPKRVMVGVQVLSVSPDTLRLAVRRWLPPEVSLRPGMIVRLRNLDDPLVWVQVTAIEGGSPLIVVVRAVTAPPRAQEQRGYFRAALDQRDAVLLQTGAGRAARLSVRLLDLSGSGARVFVHRALSEEEPAALRLDLDDNRPPLTIPAEVVWQSAVPGGRQAGLRFRDISEADRDRLIRFVLLTDVHQRQTV